MLVRIACESCLAAALWTDDPNAFLHTVCRNRGRCVARLTNELQEEVSPAGSEPGPLRRNLAVRGMSSRRRAVG